MTDKSLLNNVSVLTIFNKGKTSSPFTFGSLMFIERITKYVDPFPFRLDF